MMLTDLPLDLESEILSRVPATSLQRLKTTCKRWYALFRDPRFVKTWVKQQRM
ncbi:putative F-box domain-containing protein [Arabidopsis thaliana]